MKPAHILSAIALASLAPSASAKLCINELMQSNISCLYAEGDFPDSWVEIYNDSDANLRLTGYYLGTTPEVSEAFRLTGLVRIPKNGYTVIYCDKQGEKSGHTDFRIDSGKGSLYLFSPEGEIIDHVSFPKQPAPNVAYGRVSDMSPNWGYQLNPTPRAANAGGVTDRILPEPVFSRPGYALINTHKLDEVTVSIPQDVELPADTRLYVTTDGSDPTLHSPSYDKEFTARFSSTTVVRAKLISSQAISPTASTHSFILHKRDVDLPIISINTDSEYFFDPQIGIWENYSNNWRRPINVEYFVESGSEAKFNQLGECRIHGGWTRANAQKSLAVYSNKRFGTKKYSYPFFPDKPEIKKSKSFVLRNGGNSFADARIKDSFVQTLFGRNVPNLDWQAYQPAICYINGQYRGIYAIRQRSNEDYVEDCYDGLEDIDMIENWNELKAGSYDSFEALKALYSSNPTFSQMDAAIDTENFANLYIADAWATNTDFPGNNIVMWRPSAEGGKWRWIMKDLDFFATNPTDFSYFDWLLHTGSFSSGPYGEGNASHAVKLFQVMTSMPEFREPFIDRFLVYLGDFLQPEVTSALINEQRDILRPEYQAHLAAYGNPTSFSSWLSHIENMRAWTIERTEKMPGLIASYFNPGSTTIGLTIDTSHASGATINDIPLTQPTFRGKWISGRKLALSSANPCGWKVEIADNLGNVTSESFDSPQCEFCWDENVKSVRIEPYELSGIEKISAGSSFSVISADGVTRVQAPEFIHTVNIYDTVGKIILSESPMSDSATIGHSLPRGIYIIEVTTIHGSRHTEKIRL